MLWLMYWLLGGLDGLRVGWDRFNESPITISNDKLEPLGSRILDPMLKKLKGVNQRPLPLIKCCC